MCSPCLTDAEIKVWKYWFNKVVRERGTSVRVLWGSWIEKGPRKCCLRAGESWEFKSEGELSFRYWEEERERGRIVPLVRIRENEVLWGKERNGGWVSYEGEVLCEREREVLSERKRINWREGESYCESRRDPPSCVGLIKRLNETDDND